jgi:hypothetical protein
MRTEIVKRIDLPSCIHAEFHEIQIPEFKDEGFYRTMISYDAFFESPKRRNKNDDYLYLVVTDNTISDSMREKFPDVVKREEERDANLPRIKHDSLYDFFEYIGYDRKKQKIIQKTDV